MLDHDFTVASVESMPLNRSSELATLEGRLERGWKMIEEQEADNLPADQLLRHFLELLTQYEAECDRSQAVV